eukprot:jgi/Chlat1/1631/Chrsp127S01946
MAVEDLGVLGDLDMDFIDEIAFLSSAAAGDLGVPPALKVDEEAAVEDNFLELLFDGPVPGLASCDEPKTSSAESPEVSSALKVPAKLDVEHVADDVATSSMPQWEHQFMPKLAPAPAPAAAAAAAAAPVQLGTQPLLLAPPPTPQQRKRPLALRDPASMPVAPQPIVPASPAPSVDEGLDDEAMKRQKRLIRNRESASLSRERKKSVFAQLQVKVQELERANQHLNYHLGLRNLEKQALLEELKRYRTAAASTSSSPSPNGTTKGNNGGVVAEPAALTRGSLQSESTPPQPTQRVHCLLSLFFLSALLPVPSASGGSEKDYEAVKQQPLLPSDHLAVKLALSFRVRPSQPASLRVSGSRRPRRLDPLRTRRCRRSRPQGRRVRRAS